VIGTRPVEIAECGPFGTSELIYVCTYATLAAARDQRNQLRQFAILSELQRVTAPDRSRRPMRNLLVAGKLLLLDLASTFFFLILYSLTKNIPLSVALGMALGVAQIGWEFVRKRPIDTMQWLSLFLVIGFGTATLITDNPRFVMVKPSLIYIVVGVVMLKPGWMNRYLPPAALELVPDIAAIFGFVWSGLMFFSAALNAIVALNYSVATWASFMTVYGIVSKFGLFTIQYATMRYIAIRRRAQMTPAPP
jgi:intracellular septation protein